MVTAETVELVEVGPRDGLQNEGVVLSPQAKIAFVDALSRAGHTRIEVTAFVSPRRVPQMADAAEVMSGIHRETGVRYSALVPNDEGMRRALATGVTEIAVFTAASETFNLKNIGAGIDESFDRFRSVVAVARAEQVRVRGYLSTVIHCPYEGRVDHDRTVELVKRLLDLGCFEVSLGETLGMALPSEVSALCDKLASADLLEHCAGHFHDTYGRGLTNVLAAFDAGIRTFDCSAGGLGGCPYAPGAAGNVATEDLVHLFRGQGLQVAGDLRALVSAARLVEHALGRDLPGKTYRALRCDAPPAPTQP